RCRPDDRQDKGPALRIVHAQVDRLEREIDGMNAGLAPLNSFVLPGGTAAAAHLHLARTIVRRAEREMTALAVREKVNPLAIKYINRLSDHLFVLARALNDNGAKDVLWQPGATREVLSPDCACRGVPLTPGCHLLIVHCERAAAPLLKAHAALVCACGKRPGGSRVEFRHEGSSRGQARHRRQR